MKYLDLVSFFYYENLLRKRTSTTLDFQSCLSAYSLLEIHARFFHVKKSTSSIFTMTQSPSIVPVLINCQKICCSGSNPFVAKGSVVLIQVFGTQVRDDEKFLDYLSACRSCCLSVQPCW